MITVWGRIAHKTGFSISVILFLALCLPRIWISSSLAQVPITSSGLKTQISAPTTLPSGQINYDITGGTRPGGGANLFHSFGNFNVPTNNIANFLNAGSVDLAGNPLAAGLPTSNILGRVTGSNISNIFGTIQTTNFGNANLFLMNPHGFLFGPTATVNVGGMVTFTSADYLKLADGVRFTAIPDTAADALLSAAPVAAFGFLGSNPGAITVQGSQLAVQPSQGLELIGGNITVQNGTLDNGTVQPAKLSAPGGQIHLASVASPGEIVAGTLDQAPNVNGQSFGALGAIQVSQKSVIDASGDGGGTVLIRGGRFVLDNSTISANTTGPAVGPLVGQPGAGIDVQVSQDAVIQNAGVLETNVSPNVAPGIGSGGVRVTADLIEIVGILPDFTKPGPPPPFTGIRSNVAAGSTGNSGDITLEANSISMKNLAQIQTQATGIPPSPTGPPSPPTPTGNAGNIIMKADQNLEVNFSVILSNSAFASGNSGNIELTSTHGNIVMTNASAVTTQTILASGNAGSLTVSAPEGNILLSDFVQLFNATRGTGALGPIQITAKNLQILNRSNLNGDNFTNSATQVPGNITVNISGSLSLDGSSFLKTTAEGSSPAADLNITAHDVSIGGGSVVSVETFSSVPGGQLNIFTNSLQLTNGGQLRSGSTIFTGVVPSTLPRPFPSGPGGAISIQGLTGPAASVLIDGAGSGIFTNTTGTGPGGTSNIAAQSVTIQNGGTISASTSGTAPTAKGGDISITADQSVTLNNNASITASSTGPANAGDIVINAGQNYTSTNSSVTTAAAQASGGNITVLATDTVQLTNSQLNASVQGASTTVGGNIVIDPQFVILQNSQILAQALLGAGGDISITTNLFLPDSLSIVDASSQFGVNGNVTIQSPISQAGGKIVPLSNMPLETTGLLGQRCAALAAGGQFSSFVMTGRDVLPTEPGGWLASPLAAVTAGASPSAQGEGDTLTPALSQGEREQIVSVRRLSPPAAGMKIFSTDWMAGCGS